LILGFIKVKHFKLRKWDLKKKKTAPSGKDQPTVPIQKPGYSICTPSSPAKETRKKST
jgi:hypothetical protein